MVYQLDDTWKLRTGVALDETPVPDKYSRSPRTPDADRKWVSVGAGYKVSSKMSIDFAYTRIMADRADVDYTLQSDLGNSVLVGSYDLSVDILSAQLVWTY
jgi:long-chain fatty acid transport protein